MIQEVVAVTIGKLFLPLNLCDSLVMASPEEDATKAPLSTAAGRRSPEAPVNVWEPDQASINRFHADLQASLHDVEATDVLDLLLREMAHLKAHVEVLSHAYSSLLRITLIDQRLLAQPASASSAPPFAQECQITADSAGMFSENGFHQIEHNLDGVPFRWSGPSQVFAFDLFVDRSRPLEIILTTLPTTNANADQPRLFCAAGTMNIPLHCQQTAQGLAWRGILPADASLGRTRLAFRVEPLFRPSDVDPDSSDDRLLGLPVIGLAVSPVAGTGEDGDGIPLAPEPDRSDAAAGAARQR